MSGEVMDALARGAILLAATPGLAADWKRRYVASVVHKVCKTPSIHAWRGWLQQMARCNARLPLPLTPCQELDLWQREISADVKRTGGHELTTAQVIGLAAQARRSYARMCDYLIDTDALLPGNAEHEAFHRWCIGVRRRLEAMPERMLAAELPAYGMRQRLLPTGTEVLLAGLDAPCPAAQRLFAALEAQGVRIRPVDAAQVAGELRLAACEDEGHEVRHVASRVAALLEARPEMRIGILHPAPDDVAARLERELSACLSASSAFSAAAPAPVLSRPCSRLSDTPLGQMALMLLSLAGKRQLRFAELSALLLSPYIAGAEREAGTRAALEAALRADNQHIIWLPTALDRKPWQQVPALADALRQLMAWEQTPRLPSAWVLRVQALWQRLLGLRAGAPGNAFEVVQVNALGDALTGLAGLDAGGHAMSWAAFSAFLRRTMHEARMPAADGGGMQLLGMDEAAGLCFDHVFVLGMDEERWPMMARPDPFIPVPVQQHVGMASASAALAFAESERLWRHVLHSAPVIEASFAQQQQGKKLLPSPMCTTAATPVLPLAPAWRELMPGIDVCTAPFTAVPLATDKVPGGSLALRDQSACPFRYVVSHRLSVRALEDTEAGLSARDRGTLVHRVLELIWVRIGDQANLMQMLAEEAGLDAMLHDVIREAWRAIAHPVERHTRRLETRRLHGLLQGWLAHEARRAPFTVVEREAWRTWRAAGGGGTRRLRLKLDRVDADDAGRRMVIDYKTGGKSGATGWLSERLPEPQLPLYAVVEADAGHVPAAVCFAYVRSGELGFAGLAAEDVGMAGVRPWRGQADIAEDWPGLINWWRQQLQALMAEISAGHCAVAPRDEKACDYCELRAVCRIDAMREGLL